MKANYAQMNLILGWLWIVLGFVSGAIMGFNFRFFNEKWAGGYSGLKRRLYRLGHISFFGLALINLLFYFTVQMMAINGLLIEIASKGFLLGAVTMPICCFLIAHYTCTKHFFYVPVINLIVGGFLTFLEVIKL